MHAHKAPAAPDIPLEGGFLLLVIKNLVVHVAEHDRLVALQVLVREHVGVFGDLHREAMFGPKFADGFGAGGHVVVNVLARLFILGINEDPPGGVGSQEGTGQEAEEQAQPPRFDRGRNHLRIRRFQRVFI